MSDWRKGGRQMAKDKKKGIVGKTVYLTSGVVAVIMVLGTAFTLSSYNVHADESDMGWREENGVKYWYENGVKQGTEGRGKEIYDPGSDAWYWLDAVDGGKMAVSKDVYQESGAGEWGDYEVDGVRMGKWVRYDENGHMIKGWQTNDAGTYYFDPVYGTMAKGDAVIDGKPYHFDEVTGILSAQYDDNGNSLADDGWHMIDGTKYWYEGGVRQGTEGRGKEIYDPGSEAWYWLDAVDGGKMAVSKDVYQESGAGEWGDYEVDGVRMGKWVRYDENGHMIKGWQTTQAGTYYFDPVYGTMAKGWAAIDGVSHHFNETTGVEEAAADPCNTAKENSHNKYYHKYEHAYRTKDMSLIETDNDMQMYEAIKNYLDYAYKYDDDFSRIKAIHDYMCWTNEYDLSLSHYGIKCVLLEHTSVCNGYALTFAMFMDMLGIENDRIISYQLDHTWNAVKLEGDWYLIDVTNDDYCDFGECPDYRYFMLPAQYFDSYEATDYCSVNNVDELIPDPATMAAYGMKMIANENYYTEGDDDGQQEELYDSIFDAINKLKKYDIFTVYYNGTLSHVNNYDTVYTHYRKYYDDIVSYTRFNNEVGNKIFFVRFVMQYDGIEDYLGNISKIGYKNAISMISEKLVGEMETYGKDSRYGFYIDFPDDYTEQQIKKEMENIITKVQWYDFICGGYRYTYIIQSGKAILSVAPIYDDYNSYLSEYEFIVSEEDFCSKLDETLGNVTKELYESGNMKISFIVTSQNWKGWNSYEEVSSLLNKFTFSKWNRIYKIYTERLSKPEFEEGTVEKYMRVIIYPSYTSYEEAIATMESNYFITGYDNAVNQITKFLNSKGLYTSTGKAYWFFVTVGEGEKVPYSFGFLNDIASKSPYNIYYYMKKYNEIDDKTFIFQCMEYTNLYEYKVDDTTSDEEIINRLEKLTDDEHGLGSYNDNAVVLEYRLTGGKTFAIDGKESFKTSSIYSKLKQNHYSYNIEFIDGGKDWTKCIVHSVRKSSY